MSEPPDSNSSKRITLDPSVMAKLLEQMQMTNNLLSRSKGGGKSNYPYYNESAAMEIKEAVLAVLNTREPMVWPARDVSDQTLYNKWKQGSEYLVTVLEPEFKDTLRLVTCTRLPKHGLRISPVKVRSALKLMPEIEWRPQFTEFIDTANHKDKFERVIPLSDEDIKWITGQMTDVEHLFITDINETGLTIIRYDK